jgi:diguanylate cyclase (GGDEF)-like protein/PAS domain S-box-containing protein
VLIAVLVIGAVMAKGMFDVESDLNALRVDGSRTAAAAELQAHAEATAARTRQLALFLGGVALLFAVMGIRRLRYGFVRPVRALAAAAERVGRGDLQQPLEIDRDDEFGRLAKGFNRMMRLRHDAQTQLQDALDQAAEAERLFRTTFESAPVGVALVDLGDEQPGRLLRVNEAMATLTGRTEKDLLWRRLTDLIDPDAVSPFADLDDLHGRFERETLIRHADGSSAWTLLTSAPVGSRDGSPAYAVVLLVDISERKHFETRLRELAERDSLTGLFNRRRFDGELERALGNSSRYGAHGAVILLDLDGFKYVNDTFGHSIGDQLLARIGNVLHGAVRSTDVVARLGGDEFAVLLPHADTAEAEVVAQKLLEAVELNGTVVEGGRQTRVTTSIGIAPFVHHPDRTREDVMVEADIALYAAKDAGRNTYTVFEEGDAHRERILTRALWLERLQRGLAEDRFVLFAMPIVRLSDGEVVRHELLLRFRDENGDLIAPGAFLPIAERFDLIGDIDRWVLRQGARLVSEAAAAGRPINASLNLSGRTVGDPGLSAYLTEVLTEFPVPVGSLVLEVTETEAIVELEQAQRFVSHLRSLGCRFALDDFGSGFATFAYLKHLTFDYLKIDGEFVGNLGGSPADRMVVQAVVDIAKGLGSETIAEFVEDEETVEMLREIGVTYGQGYHIGRPVDSAEVFFADEPAAV